MALIVLPCDESIGRQLASFSPTLVRPLQQAGLSWKLLVPCAPQPSHTAGFLMYNALTFWAAVACTLFIGNAAAMVWDLLIAYLTAFSFWW